MKEHQIRPSETGEMPCQCEKGQYWHNKDKHLEKVSIGFKSKEQFSSEIINRPKDVKLTSFFFNADTCSRLSNSAWYYF